MFLWLLACTPPDVVPTETTDVVSPPVEARVEVLPSAPCRGDANDRPFGVFSEPYATPDWEAQTRGVGNSQFMIGSGVGVGDLDQDGFNDLLLPKNGDVTLWYGDGLGGYTRQVLLVDRGQFTAAVPVDFDGDGDLDVYVSRYDGPDLLLQNDAERGFNDVAAEAGLGDEPYGIGSSWADMDGDGDLDLLVLKHGNFVHPDSERSHIYRSNGDGTFEDVTTDHWSGTQGYGHTLAGGFIDLDEDGLPEIYLVNDYGYLLPNQMYWNRPEGFVQAERSTGLDLRLCGMGVADADIDGDHRPDLFHSSWLELRLLATSGTDVWIDFTGPSGIRVQRDLGRHVAWGNDFGDVDNDGDQDLWIGFGAIVTNVANPPLQPDALYIRQPNQFVEAAVPWGAADPRRTRGGMLVDLDADGRLDLVKRNKDALPVVLFGTCGTNHWLEIELRDDGPNTRAIGARVRVIAGENDQVRWVRAGGRSLSSGGPPEVHFGLWTVDRVDVEVTWPDGEIELFTDLAADQRLRIHR